MWRERERGGSGRVSGWNGRGAAWPGRGAAWPGLLGCASDDKPQCHSNETHLHGERCLAAE